MACQKPSFASFNKSIITLDNVLRDPTSGFPTKAEVSEKLELYKCITNTVGGFPSGLTFEAPSATSPGGLAIGMELTSYLKKGFSRNDSTIKMLEHYAQVMDFKFPKEIKDALKGLDTDFVFDLADKQIGEWVNTGSELMSTALAHSGEVAKYTGEAMAIDRKSVV